MVFARLLTPVTDRSRFSSSFAEDTEDTTLIMNLLEIQSSARQTGALSRQLSQEFVQAWTSLQTESQHQSRDVAVNPPAHLTEL